MFSATPEQFEQQMYCLKRAFRVVRLEEALEFVEHPSRLRGPHVLITFDDGYLDNYSVAAAILSSLGLQGTFFLPTSFIGTDLLPWWDRIAFLLSQSSASEIVLDYPRPLRLKLSAGSRRATLRAVLSLYKSRETTDLARFLDGLERAAGAPLPAKAPTRQFMNWAEADTMKRQGMAFGSHTHNHELLGKLTFDEQLQELSVSRQILQERLSVRSDVLAYPVGTKDSFSATTYQALEQAGYRAAFSFYGGVNLPGRLRRFDVLRLSVDSEMSVSRFRMRLALAAAFGRNSWLDPDD